MHCGRTSLRTVETLLIEALSCIATAIATSRTDAQLFRVWCHSEQISLQRVRSGIAYYVLTAEPACALCYLYATLCIAFRRT